MMVVSIETTLEPWASSLRDVKARMRSLFTRERVAVSAGQFLDGLPKDERRKTGWLRAEAAGDPGPWRQQAILGRGHRDADALRDIVREYTLETPSDADAVLVTGVGKSWCLGGEMGDRKSAVKDGSSRDGDAMCALWGPPHATSFAHTGVADVIDTALRTGRRNCETVSTSKHQLLPTPPGF